MRESSPVGPGQGHEGGNWFGGLEGGLGVHCVEQEVEHDFIVVWRMAEGVATVGYRLQEKEDLQSKG
eukprot:61431-Pelagomonas_calceolata.AAC.1